MQDIVIGQTAEIGDNCRIYSDAKLIAKGEGDRKLVEEELRTHPNIGNNCMLEADSLVIGPVTMGDNVTVAAGAIVTKNVLSYSIVTGVNIIKSKDNYLD